MSEFKNLILDVADGIAVLKISRPAAMNALNSETLDELKLAHSVSEHPSHSLSYRICVR